MLLIVMLSVMPTLFYSVVLFSQMVICLCLLNDGTAVGQIEPFNRLARTGESQTGETIIGGTQNMLVCSFKFVFLFAGATTRTPCDVQN